jgi:Methyladenine glycosylase
MREIGKRSYAFDSESQGLLFMATKRCSWVSTDNPLMLQYHDREWGVPVHDDRKHFEFLVLEAALAGRS